MKVQIQLATEAGIGSALIRWLGWDDYSHVDVVLPVGTQLNGLDCSGHLLGARLSGGVRVRPPGYKKFTRTARYELEVEASALGWLFSQLGKPYDWRAIVNFVLHRKGLRKPGAWICSELVEEFAAKGGNQLLNTLKVWRVTPGDIELSPVLIGKEVL